MKWGVFWWMGEPLKIQKENGKQCFASCTGVFQPFEFFAVDTNLPEMAMLASKDFYSSKKVPSSGAGRGSLDQGFITELTWHVLVSLNWLWCQYCHFWQLRINCENLDWQQWWSGNPKLQTITINAISTDCSGQQESIRVGCIPPACWSCRGCVSRGVSVSGSGGWGHPPLPPDLETDTPPHVYKHLWKHYLAPNFVCGR